MHRRIVIYGSVLATLGIVSCTFNQKQFDADYAAGKYDYARVVVTQNSQMTAGCAFIGKVNSGFASYREQAEDNIKQKAYAMGATVVFVGPQGIGHDSIDGEAYKCQAAPDAAPIDLTPKP